MKSEFGLKYRVDGSVLPSNPHSSSSIASVVQRGAQRPAVVVGVGGLADGASDRLVGVPGNGYHLACDALQEDPQVCDPRVHRASPDSVRLDGDRGRGHRPGGSGGAGQPHAAVAPQARRAAAELDLRHERDCSLGLHDVLESRLEPQLPRSVHGVAWYPDACGPQDGLGDLPDRRHHAVDDVQKIDHVVDDPKRLVYASDIDPDVELLGEVVLGLDFDLDEGADTDRAGDLGGQHGTRDAEPTVFPGACRDRLIESKQRGDAHSLTLSGTCDVAPRVVAVNLDRIGTDRTFHPRPVFVSESTMISLASSPTSSLGELQLASTPTALAAPRYLIGALLDSPETESLVMRRQMGCSGMSKDWLHPFSTNTPFEHLRISFTQDYSSSFSGESSHNDPPMRYTYRMRGMMGVSGSADRPHGACNQSFFFTSGVTSKRSGPRQADLKTITGVARTFSTDQRTMMKSEFGLKYGVVGLETCFVTGTR
jgi:hypothetical protein